MYHITTNQLSPDNSAKRSLGNREHNHTVSRLHLETDPDKTIVMCLCENSFKWALPETRKFRENNQRDKQKPRA